MKFTEFKTHNKRTSGIISFSTTISIIISYLIAWLLVGEIDLLNLKWFITPFQYMKDGVLVTREIFFNMNILYIWIGIIGLCLFVFSILKFWLQKINWDILPFIVMGNVIGIVLFCTGFIPYTKENSIWIILARFIIIITAGLISFFSTNAITTKILLSGNDSAFIYEELKDEYQELKKIKKENDSFLKSREKEKNYIEIDGDE